MSEQYNEESRNMYQGHQYSAPNKQMNCVQPQYITLCEPYMYQTLQSLVNCPVIIETMKGTVRGTLTNVYPDHVVLAVSGNCYFVRLQQINWVMPTHAHQPHPNEPIQREEKHD